MTYNLDVSLLVRQYHDEGYSVYALAKRHGVDFGVVKSRLLRAGVVLRSRKENYAANCARDPDFLVGLGAPRKYPLNEGFFDIRTPEMAYVVGLFQSDGHNDPTRYRMSISLKYSDRALLEAVSECVGSGRPLEHVVGRSTDNACLALNSRKMSEGLASWGVVSPKSHSASTDSRLLNDHDYWRGVVDGDGSLCVAATGTRILSLVGSYSLCSEWLEFVRSHGHGRNVNVNRHRTIWSVQIRNSAAIHMAGVLYDGASLALERKRRVSDEWSAS